MIFLKEFGRCATMSEKCPNCGQLTNTSFSRLVKDSCGHAKCRMCLLHEEHGCKICLNNHCNVKKKDAQDDLKEPHVAKEEPSSAPKLSSEEIVLPLELVINKDTKSEENQPDTSSAKCELSDHQETVTVDNNKSCVSATNDTVTKDNSSEVHIPKIQSYNVALIIQNHLKNDNNHEAKKLESPQVVKNEVPEVSQELQDKTKIGEQVVVRKKPKLHNRNHILVLPGVPERYKCSVCCKIFRNKKGKCYHDACVTGIKPYQCTMCDRSFVKRSHFEYHERVHRGYKPHKCNLCDKAFPQRNKLNRHMISHSREKQFICPECNKRYSKREDLKNHLSVHNSKAVHKCKFCDKSFCVLNNLKRHLQTHASERPYKCDQCSKGFKDRSLLVRHKRIHGKERPFSCGHCTKVFLSKSELRRHVQVHTDEKPFSCEYCQTLFRRKDNLTRHIRHHHTEDSGEVRKTIVVETDQACSAKSDQQQQKQKSRKTQPKSAVKVTATSPPNSRDQVNSRLDPMGNITPVIRVIGEVSNAVPVINGPINIRRLEDGTDKKIFTYTQPIPIAKAVVLNCRIEEKLYPQSASTHNYFVLTYLKDQNSKVNSYPNNKLASQENQNSVAVAASSGTQPLPPKVTANQDSTNDVCREKIAKCEEQNTKQGEKENEEEEKHCEKEGKSKAGEKLAPDATSSPESNCVSTIKKHTTQQSKECSSENSADASNLDTTNHATPKDSQNSGKKKGDIHWRRRIAEKLKPT